MKVNFNIPIKSYKEEPIKGPNGEAIPIKDAICQILAAVTFGTAREKVKIAELSGKIWTSSSDIEISDEEAVLIKNHCKELPAVLFAQVYKLIEQQ